MARTPVRPRRAARLLGGHAAAEERGRGQVAPMARVGRAHHVLGVPHLLRQLGHRQRAVLLAAAARQRREADHEEVQPREGDQVDRQLAQVRVQLPCARVVRRRQAASGGALALCFAEREQCQHAGLLSLFKGGYRIVTFAPLTYAWNGTAPT